MGKNFKDIYEEGLGNETKKSLQQTSETTPIEPVKILLDEGITEEDDLSKRSDDKLTFAHKYELDEHRRQISEELREAITEEVKEELKEQLREDVKKELYEELYTQIYDSVQKDVLEHVLSKASDVNTEVMGVIGDLSDKISKLTENLNIEIPTPVVNVTIPKTRKKVVRDENGFIESIEDVEDDE
jgi:membrane-associated HD superfamily phosphohydrolase